MKHFFLICALTLVSLAGFAKLPSFDLKNIEGETINTATLSNDGKPIIISFFATWCKPCLRELGAINEVYADWQDETGVKLIAISIDQGQNSNRVKPLVDGNGWEYEVLLDPNSALKQAMNIQSVPSVIILDGKGEIVFRHTGYTTGGEEELIEKVRELIK